jgi:adenylate cyclase class 1
MPHSGQRISFDEGISRKDLRTIQQRFLRLHRERLGRILNELSTRKRDFINLLPLLFHINHPLLPGYVRNDTPKGLPDYSPSRQTLQAARKLSKSFTHKRRAQRIYQIEALYLMGSTGTIGQSSNSDFDLWLCHQPGLQGEPLALLQQKAALVEQAALERGLELHIFLVDPDKFRRGEKSRLSQESSGTTQHSLLLEEFYRSAVLLAGRYPLWWLVPPEQERNYRQYADTLLTQRFIKPSNVIDLGGLDQIPAEEFFGAALWQIYKGISSPYKSILKIFLMEAYSRDYPHPSWLAQQAKEAIYTDETDLNELDAYILLYRRVEAYLISIGDHERLELARRCFYFKVDEELSGRRGMQHWRGEMLFGLTRDWGWSQAQLQLLDRRAEWKIDQVIRERNILVGVLSRSYRLLTDFARQHASQSQIDPKELSLLGRKLFTALDHRPGKIDHINPGISRNLAESHLTLLRRASRDGSLVWMLFRGQLGAESALDQRPIKLSPNLVEILLWSHINQVWGPQTLVTLAPSEHKVARNEMFELHRSLKQHYPQQRMPMTSTHDLSQPAQVTRAIYFINIGTDPLEHFSKLGRQLASDRHDPFSFASTRSNLVINMEELMETSWGELLVSRREGDEGLLSALCNLLNLYDPSRCSPPPPIDAFSHSCVRGKQIATRLSELFGNVMAYFSDAAHTRSRYAFRMGWRYFLIQQGNKGYDWWRLDTLEELLEDLQQPQPTFRDLAFDPEILGDTPYPVIYRHNRPGIIQLFYRLQPDQLQLFLLDEQGSLFRQSQRMENPRFLMQQQQRFFHSLQQLRSLLASEPGTPLLEPEFYEIVQDRRKAWSVEPRMPPQNNPDDYLELTLVTDSLNAGAKPISLICGDQEFTHLEFGEEFYRATAIHLQNLRRKGHAYPFYLTALQSTGIHGLQSLSTVEMLNLKCRVEDKLNRSLAG